MAPAPAPSTAPAGALPNTLEVERLYTIACEKVEQQFCLKKMEPVEPKNQLHLLQLRLHFFCKESEPSQTEPYIVYFLQIWNPDTSAKAFKKEISTSAKDW